jgi:hypothetical protein
MRAAGSARHDARRPAAGFIERQATTAALTALTALTAIARDRASRASYNCRVVCLDQD